MTPGTPRSASERPPVTRTQWLTLLLATLAWLLDGFDGSMFALINGPIMADVLADGTTAPEAGQIALYGGIAVSLYLFGWAVGSIVLGSLADYLGRVRILVAGVVVFSVFSGLTALSTEFWHVAVMRLLAGIGSGVAYPVGATLIAEVWNNRYKARAISVMASGYAAGYFLASVVYWLIGDLGWRVSMLSTLAPVVLVLAIVPFVKEPQVWRDVREARRHGADDTSRDRGRDRLTIVQLFRPDLRRTTVLAAVISTGALVAFWSITTWVPQMVRGLDAVQALGTAEVTSQVALATAALNLGGFLGYMSWGSIADAIGRKWAFTLSMSCMWLGSLALFPWSSSFGLYLVLLPVIGFGVFGAFSGCAVWFPELFPAAVRATALSFTNGLGRMLTCGGPLFASAMAVSWFGGSLQLAVMAIASVGLVAFIGIIALPETRPRRTAAAPAADT
ncbi:MFS transporter [Pseudonocardia sp. MH-G8]|uniref:MFS transporter n=1 Tax=Pseudonocardia sp. MH-G8 TaxID=1854588 RepID=UPI000BA171CE|nr:MFS transporter [Pseudonocardia sp. MH-G8]OZM77135.1 MFS transporter [Pseudonocardia sp. MH-G8]